MAKNTDEIETSDYKLTKDGKKIKAHRIIFNKGEEQEEKLDERTLSTSETNKREDIVKGMKKNYKGFVSKYGKDRAKSVMYATATKLAKEETELVDEQLKGGQVKLDKNKNGKLDKEDFKKLRKEEIEMMDEAHPFDIPKSSGMATSTKTKHDVKKTSTGTVYTKQRDSDGMAKEFKRDPDEAKRGRGRPKKNSFSEAAEFLMSLSEEQFNDVTSEGFDIFFESFENINK